MEEPTNKQAQGNTDAGEKLLLKSIIDLSNTVAHSEAHGNLMKLKASQRHLFASPRLLVKVHAYLSQYTYELRVRQFILALFHQEVPLDRLEAWHALDAALNERLE